jgi:hypothetical protein
MQTKKEAHFSQLKKDTFESIFVPAKNKWDPTRARNLHEQETKNRGYNILSCAELGRVFS